MGIYCLKTNIMKNNNRIDQDNLNTVRIDQDNLDNVNLFRQTLHKNEED